MVVKGRALSAVTAPPTSGLGGGLTAASSLGGGAGGGDSLTVDGLMESPPLTPMCLNSKEDPEISMASDPGWEERRQGIREGGWEGGVGKEGEGMHYATKPGHFETSIIHFPTSEGVSEVSKRANK